jgi:hypothetical protein
MLRCSGASSFTLRLDGTVLVAGGSDCSGDGVFVPTGAAELYIIAPAPAPSSTGWGALAAAPTQTPRRVPGPMRAMGLLGLVLAVVMIIAGVLFVIPSLGTFGIIWTGMAVLILVINGRRFISRGW